MCIRILASVFVLCSFAACPSRAQTALAPTPPMGWNSWNHFACKVTAADVRGLYRQLPTRTAGCANLRGVGRGLSEIRLVQRVPGLSGQPDPGGLQENARRAREDPPADRVQLVRIRLGPGLEMGQGRRREFVADERRHPGPV